ncbi:hypothetical protein Q31b_02290 [Novipirellula aureliae]|uniref:Uncharacterized protein n=1 Tax=Novipirellula aureliae TaxID=2527966 RepID=A0A5C6E8C1_9BACT|nr:hypothetical protein Q31b_02290 [Novipirellula aureliae]
MRRWEVRVSERLAYERLGVRGSERLAYETLGGVRVSERLAYCCSASLVLQHRHKSSYELAWSKTSR